MRQENIPIKNIIYFVTITFILLIILTVPISAGDIGPSHELDDGLDVDVSVAEDENGEKLTQDASITYDIKIEAQNKKNTYPYIYPIDLEISEDDEFIDSETIFLMPTQSNNYIPTYGSENEEGYGFEEEFQIYLNFNDHFEDDLDENENLKRTLDFDFTSRHTEEDEYSETRTDDIHGETPQGRSSTSASISQTSGFDETSETTHVDRFRIQESEEDAGFLEDYTIPYSEDFSGTVENFQNVREPNNDKSTFIRAGSNGFNMITQTRNVPRSEPQTIAITYNIFDGEELTVNPVQSNTQSIDEDTEYVLPNEPEDSEYCQEISNSDGLCLFTLSSEETSELNNLGELYLEFDSGEEYVSAEIFCQGIISGYLSEDAEICGKSGVVNSDLIEISEFKGVQIDEDERMGEFSEPYVNLNYPDDDLSDAYADVEIDSSINAQFEDGSISVDTYIVKESNIDDSEISNPIYEDTVNLDSGNNDAIKLDDETVYYQDITDVYVFVVCESGDDECSTTNNIDIDYLYFGTNEQSGGPELNLKMPEIIQLESMNDEFIVEERIQTQTTDDSYAENNQWQEVETINDFEGIIEETVVVEDVPNSNPSEIEDKAEAKLSDINGEWRDNYESFVSVNDTEFRYTDSRPSSEWESVSSTPERTAQVGTEEETFNIISGAEFQSLTESERGWYLDRDSEASTSEIEHRDILHRHEDPDNCYNCLRAETQDEAKERLNSSSNEELIKSLEDEENWNRVSDEVTYESLQESDVSFRTSSADLDEGYMKIFERENDDEEEEGDEYVVWRNSDYDQRPIYEWERTKTTNELPFKSPIMEQITEYQKTTYDIEYIFEGDITEPSDLHTYEKEVEVEISDWKPKTVWYDFSNSNPNPETSIPLSLISVSYVGTSETHHIEWHDDIHYNSPEEIDNMIDNGEICDDNSRTKENVGGGVGGIGIIETCNIDGEEYITRIGKEYDQEGEFEPEIALYDESLASESYNHNVIVNEDVGVPELNDFEAENSQVDYKVGKIAIAGEIMSDNNQLHEPYELEISPSDSFTGNNKCPTNYYRTDNIDIQRQSSTTDLFRETYTCTMIAFEDFDEAPEEFVRYTENTTTGEIEPNDEIEAGAIQTCQDEPLTDSGSGECEIDDEYNIGDDNTITYKSDNQNDYSSVDGTEISPYYCPAGYEMEEGFNVNQEETDYVCSLDNELDFNMQSRQLSIDYKQIPAGVIRECSDIVTSNEVSQDHNGYTNEADNEEDQYCELNNPSDPGPDGFTLYDSSEDEYHAPPAGAVRGVPLEDTSDDNAHTEDDGKTFIYTYETDNNEEIDIRYATMTEGQWNHIPNGIDTLDIDRHETQDIIWESDFITSPDSDNPSEEFTTVINPRQIQYSEDQIGENSTVEFELTLRPALSEGIIQSETIEVQLCQAPEGKSLLRENLGQKECDGFDTLLSGQDDFNTSRDSVSNVISEFDGPGEYTIETTKNDICPYHLDYPRGDLTEYTFEVEGEEDDYREPNWDDISNEAKNSVIHQYSVGEHCIDEDELTSTPSQNQQTFTFDANSFRNAQSTDNIRRIGVTELNALQANSVMDASQTRWSNDDLGGSLRLGSPIIPNQDKLVSVYTFDHEPEVLNQPHNKFGNTVGELSTPSKVTDVYSEDLSQVESDIVSNVDDYDSYQNRLESNRNHPNDVHHARLVYGTGCSQSHNHGITHQFSGTSSIDCEQETMNREEAEEFIDRNGDILGDENYQWRENIDSQSAILSGPPTGSGITSEQFPDSENYKNNGLFGGNSLYLDETSWLMISPPCINENHAGEDLENVGGLDSVRDDCTHDGGHGLSYPPEADVPEKQLNNVLNESNYTISFWVKEESSDETRFNQPQHPFKNLFGISAPTSTRAQGMDGTASRERPYAHTTAELNLMQIPNIDDQLTYFRNPEGNAYEEADIETETIITDDGEEIEVPQHFLESGYSGISSVYPVKSFAGTDLLSDSPYIQSLGSWIGDFSSGQGAGDSMRDEYDSLGTDDYYPTRNTNYEHEEWNHVVITSKFTTNDWDPVNNEPPRSFEVYVNGESQYNTERLHHFSSPYYSNVIRDTGRIYEDGVISIGARYLDAEYGQNDVYAPQIEATHGGMYIDDMRIYNGTVEELRTQNKFEDEPEDGIKPLRGEIGQLYSDAISKSGSINSRRLSQDGEYKDIDSISPYSLMDVQIDYENSNNFEVDIIPCDEDRCKSYLGTTINGNELNDLDSTTKTFDINNVDDLGSIEGLRLSVNMWGDSLDETPIINDIQVSFDESPYITCQDISSNHPTFAGNDFIADLGEITISEENVSVDTYEADCDMTTDGGGWTKFYWAESQGEYDDDADYLSERTIVNCEYDSETCFSPAKFNQLSNIDESSFPEHMNIDDVSEDTNPQILIKSIEDGTTNNWAAFELTDVEIEDDMENDYVNAIYEYFTGDLEDDSISASEEDIDDNCLYAFASSQDYNSNKCIDSVEIDEDTELRLSSDSHDNSRYNYINIEKQEGEVDNVSCLGESNVRCEVYYRVGSSGDYPDDIDFSEEEE